MVFPDHPSWILKSLLGGLEWWDPACTAGDTRALGVAQGTAGTPHLSLRPLPTGWAVGTHLGICVPQPGAWICVNKTFAIKRDESRVYKSGRIFCSTYCAEKFQTYGRVERMLRGESPTCPFALLLCLRCVSLQPEHDHSAGICNRMQSFPRLVPRWFGIQRISGSGIILMSWCQDSRC